MNAPDAATIRERLMSDRRALLDLSTRNRLIDIPLRTARIRTIELVDEKPIEVLRHLMAGKAMTFLPGRNLTEKEKAALAEDDNETGGIPQPGDDGLDERGVAKRHADTKLQTRLTSEGLQKRLLDLWYDARSLEEEQGVNILYLAVGLLRWYEADDTDVARHAPLILLPVRLDRTSAAERFTLRWRMEPPQGNLSLQAKMNADFGLKIEDLPDGEDTDFSAYMERVADSVAANWRWVVLPDAMALGFFSFAKFLMYRDLDPESWPAASALDRHAIIRGVLQDGFKPVEPLVADDARIDSVIRPAAMRHVVDADSSQAIAIEEASQGRNLIIKGPPGTGKSQTITNIIAAAVADGRKVLFVAEKMAALDVVHRRFKDIGLAPLVLELHSAKANKRFVLEELRRTKELNPQQPSVDYSTIVPRLVETRDALNSHAESMHTPHQPSGLTPYRLLGELLRCKEGPKGPALSLSKAETWTPADVSQRREALDELAARIETIGKPSLHDWRGVRREALDPSEVAAQENHVSILRENLGKLCRAAEEAVQILQANRPETIGDLDRMRHLLDAVTSFPDCDRRALAGPLWENGGSAVVEIVRCARLHSQLKTAVDLVYHDSAWQSSLNEARVILAAEGGSIFRWLSKRYRSALGLIRSYLKIPLPRGLSRRLGLIDGLLAAQEAQRRFVQAAPAGAAAFGAKWRGEASDWTQLKTITDWWTHHAQGLPPKILTQLLEGGPPSDARPPQAAMERAWPQFQTEWNSLAALLSFDLKQAFAVASIETVPIASLAERLEAWNRSSEQVTQWIAFMEQCRKAVSLGLGALTEGLLDGSVDGSMLMLAFDRAYYEAVRRDLFERAPLLKRFDGVAHGRIVQSFRTLDQTRMAAIRDEITRKHRADIPRDNSGTGSLGVLSGELAKKRNHLPLRQLLEKAGPTIQQLKPIFMMSPLSVAQFLKPGAVQFDLLVIDEASQIEPVDALGAMARCSQAVVVGDERQLPPTQFFAKLTSDIEDQGDDSEGGATFQARDAESVLDLCLAKGMAHRLLRWHYRSKHPSLIAVSNREFYANRLLIVPSPYDSIGERGLRFHHLPYAVYDRGNTRTNPIEARAVAEAVIQHAKTRPGESLGVGAFSVAQRQAILKELEWLRRAHPETEDFFNSQPNEPFFVKNLENIQGDERDVVFISVGYGRSATGYMPMAFGPLNRDGGERRLNVLISRAKLRCEVFSSITGDDLDLSGLNSRGVKALKLFLTFAQTGRLDVAEASERPSDSVFEEQVALALRARGHAVRTQIGSAGFFVDLAIADPEKPGRFLLGIECDGAQYHASRWARDRDRLRQRVLEDHGWIVHRVWAADWYLRPNEEISKVETALAGAKAQWAERDRPRRQFDPSLLFFEEEKPERQSDPLSGDKAPNGIAPDATAPSPSTS